MKIVFFGTSEVGLPTLELLVEHHQVLAVVTTPDAPIGRKQLLTPSPIAIKAKQLGLLVLKPEKVKDNEKLLQQLHELEANVYVVVSYGKILPKELIDIPPLKTLNIHFSLLPLYRGAAPIQAALKNGDSVTGTTIFVLDEFLDHGPVLTQVQADIYPDDTFPTLAARMALVSASELIRILPLYENGQVQLHEQDHTRATKAPMIKKEDGKADWAKSAQEIYNMWRAYQPWPGIFTSWDKKLLKITSCEVVSEPKSEVTAPGTVLPNGMVVCGQTTFLQIKSIQPEGKQSMDIKSFLNGNKTFIGSLLKS